MYSASRYSRKPLVGDMPGFNSFRVGFETSDECVEAHFKGTTGLCFSSIKFNGWNTTTADNKESNSDSESLLCVKFWLHRNKAANVPEHLLIFTDRLKCSLTEYLSNRRTSLAKRLQLAHDVLRGLRYHHKQGFTYDDLRPESVLVSAAQTIHC